MGQKNALAPPLAILVSLPTDPDLCAFLATLADGDVLPVLDLLLGSVADGVTISGRTDEVIHLNPAAQSLPSGGQLCPPRVALARLLRCFSWTPHWPRVM